MIPNMNYQNLKESYLFYNIAQKTKAYLEAHPGAHLYRMGIGDVSLPLCDAVIQKLHEAVEDQAHKTTFHGYMPECGDTELRTTIAAYYQKRGVKLSHEEVFVSSGASDELGDILDLFGKEKTVLIMEPAYPAYVDANVIAGNTIIHIPAGEENGFVPVPDPDIAADVIYICSPNNPTGAVFDREALQAWVDYANKMNAIILFDAAYESFITHDDLPHSIFEIEGAKKCAIEFCSFSKTAGFTGVRCGYTVICDELVSDGTKVNTLWARRQATKFNGVNYITQRAAEAVFTDEGQQQVKDVINYYRANAKVMVDAFKEMGVWFTGGENSPYIWHKVPDGMTSWEFFDYLLNEAEVVGTPGSGFGKNGEGFFRLTAFGTLEKTQEAMERLKKLLKK